MSSHLGLISDITPTIQCFFTSISLTCVLKEYFRVNQCLLVVYSSNNPFMTDLMLPDGPGASASPHSCLISYITPTSCFSPVLV